MISLLMLPRRLLRQAQRFRLALPTSGIVLFVTFACMLAWPSHLRSLHWWQSASVVADLSLTPEQVIAIDRVYEDSCPARYRFAEATSALFSRMQELNDTTTTDSPLVPLTAQLASTAAAAQTSTRQRMVDGLLQVLRPSQQRRLKQLIAAHLLDVD